MAVFPGQQGGPLVHIIAAKAVAFGEVLRPEFNLMPRKLSPTPRRWQPPCRKQAIALSPAEQTTT